MKLLFLFFFSFKKQNRFERYIILMRKKAPNILQLHLMLAILYQKLNENKNSKKFFLTYDYFFTSARVQRIC